MAPTAKSNGVNGHLNGTLNEDFHTLSRHPKYYIQSADLFFLLGHVLFRVHRYFFERESAWYRAKLAAPSSPGAVKCGSSDNEPIVFTDVSPEDFENFLWVFYNPRFSLYAAPAATWISILALAHRWGFAEVKAFCVRELEKKSIEELEDIDRIAVYHANHVDRNLLIPVYAALCAREQPLTLPEGIKLGMETTLVIASAREYVRSHVLEDGSRTPITPTVEDEEMEQIIRKFFGIPTPESSSASADDAPAAAAIADPADTADEVEQKKKEAKPQLNVNPTQRERGESSGARAPTTRPLSPPRRPSQPQASPLPTVTPLASTAQQPTKKDQKAGSKKTKQRQQQEDQPASEEKPQAPTQPCPALREPLVSKELPAETQERAPQVPTKTPTETQRARDPSPPFPASNLRRETGKTPKQESQPNEEDSVVDQGKRDDEKAAEEVTGEERREGEAREEGSGASEDVKEGVKKETHDAMTLAADVQVAENAIIDMESTATALENDGTVSTGQDGNAREDDASGTAHEEITPSTEAAPTTDNAQEPQQNTEDNQETDPTTTTTNTTAPASEEQASADTNDAEPDLPASTTKPTLPPLTTSTTDEAKARLSAVDSPLPGTPSSSLSKKQRKAAKKAAEKAEADRVEAEKAEREAAKKAAEKAEREATKKVEREAGKKAERDAAKKAAEKAEAKRAEVEKAEREAAKASAAVAATDEPRKEEVKPEVETGPEATTLSKKQRQRKALAAKKAAEMAEAEKAEREAAKASALLARIGKLAEVTVEPETGADTKDDQPAGGTDAHEGKVEGVQQPLDVARAEEMKEQPSPKAQGRQGLLDESARLGKPAATTIDDGTPANGLSDQGKPATEPSGEAPQPTNLLDFDLEPENPQSSPSAEVRTSESKDGKPNVGNAAETEVKDTEKVDPETDWEEMDPWALPTANSEEIPAAAAKANDISASASATAASTGPDAKQRPNFDAPRGQERNPFHNLPPKPSDGDVELSPLSSQRPSTLDSPAHQQQGSAPSGTWDGMSASDARGQRARLNSNSSVNSKHTSQRPAPSQSPVNSSSSDGIRRSPSQLTSPIAATGGRPLVNEWMPQSFRTANVAQPVSQPNESSEDPLLDLAESAKKRLKKWWG